MEQNNSFVADMPTDWWAFSYPKFFPLGICEGFDEASDIADEKYRDNCWIIDRSSLRDLREEMIVELSTQVIIAPGITSYYWAFQDGQMKLIGPCATFEDAEEKGDSLYPGNLCVLSREVMQELLSQITHELDFGLPTASGSPA
jgi:hypothetical protein